MVRPHRVEYEGAYYHVMNRGQGRQNVYHGERYYEYFLDCLEQAHKRFALDVHAYCLMSNHYHLLVRTPRGNLSRCMRHINGVYKADIRGQVSFVEIKLQDWANLIMNFTKLT